MRFNSRGSVMEGRINVEGLGDTEKMPLCEKASSSVKPPKGYRLLWKGEKVRGKEAR